MDTTLLFDFSFVDRSNESKVFDSFINENKKNILWVDGNHGVGKTRFVKYNIQKYKQYKICYFNINNEITSEDFLKDFIKTIESIGDINFISFIKKNFKSFYNTISGTIINIVNNVSLTLSSIISLMLDVSNVIITNVEEQKSTAYIIYEYLYNILNKTPLFICIDNFSRCPLDSIELFINILKPMLIEKNFKLCIITSVEEYDDEIKIQIRSNFSNKYIYLEGFKNAEFFYQILNPIFDMSSFSLDDIQYICIKCQGEPQKLSVIISKMLDKNGICFLNSKKAIIDKKILKQVLSNNYIRYSESNFNILQKWILFSFISLYDGVSILKVKKLAMYISENMYLFIDSTNEQFHKQLMELVQHKHLYTDGNILRVTHDSDYIDYVDIYENSSIKKIFSKYVYEFLLGEKTIYNRDELICKHSRIAEIYDWQKINYEYGEKLYNEKKFYEAHKLFINLYDKNNNLSAHNYLLMALNEYENGYYDICLNILKNIVLDNLKGKIDNYLYYFNYGKCIYNNSGNINLALEKIKIALNYVNKEDEEYYKIQNYLHMLFIEIPDGYEESKKIFYEIKSQCEYRFPIIWANTMRGCHNFIEDYEEAIDILNRAEKILLNPLEKWYIKNTEGFVNIRSGNINTALRIFQDSYNNIKEIKPYEASYASNNYAVCLMIKGEYDLAKDVLEDALFWNKTNYGKLFLNVHYMMCNIFLGNDILAKESMEYLTKYLDKNNPTDNIILRKLYMNLALAFKYQGNNLESNIYTKNVKKYVINTSSEFRYNKLIDVETNAIDNNIYYSYSKFDPWFVVYAHD